VVKFARLKPGMRSPYFLWGLRLRVEISDCLGLQDVWCDTGILIVYFTMNVEKIYILLIKGAQQCTIVYKQNFHCNLHCMFPES